MGNCQAAEAATVVIQHPGGKVERLYWPTSAADIMRSNPGHYVALVMLRLSEERQEGGVSSGGDGSSQATRVKLLKPKDVLLMGQVYRLITSQEVAKALREREYKKMKKTQCEQQQRHKQNPGQAVDAGERHPDSQNHHQEEAKSESDQQRGGGGTRPSGRARHWRPSLHSISEAAS